MLSLLSHIKYILIILYTYLRDNHRDNHRDRDDLIWSFCNAF